MSQPYIGEIRMIGCNFAPSGWAFCDGSLQSISQNAALFQLIGTTYGGDGLNTFALPNLQSRVPIHVGVNAANGANYVIGQAGGAEAVTLAITQIPNHTHLPQAASGATGNPVNSPANSVWSGSTGGQFSAQAPAANMNPAAVGSTGGNQPHNNMLPFQAVNFVISLFGVFPSQN